MKKIYDQQFKVVLVGSSGVGKSSLLVRFVDDEFKGDLLATIGVDFRFRTVDVEGKRTKIQIWDTAGQDTFRTIVSAYYKGADSIVIVFDLNEPASFADVRDNWRHQIQQNKEPYCKIMLIGNKCDIESGRKPPQEDIDELKKQLKTDLYFQTSAKTAVDVNKAFYQLSKTLLEVRAGTQGKKTSGKVTLKESEQKVVEKKKCCKS